MISYDLCLAYVKCLGKIRCHSSTTEMRQEGSQPESFIPTGQLRVPVKGCIHKGTWAQGIPTVTFLFNTVATMSCPLWFKNIQLPDSRDTSVNPSRDWGPQECDVTLAFIVSSSCPAALQSSCCPHRLHGHCHPPVFAQDIPEAGMHQGFLFG